MPHAACCSVKVTAVMVFSVLRHDFWIKRALATQKYVMLRANLPSWGASDFLNIYANARAYKYVYIHIHIHIRKKFQKKIYT